VVYATPRTETYFLTWMARMLKGGSTGGPAGVAVGVAVGGAAAGSAWLLPNCRWNNAVHDECAVEKVSISSDDNSNNCVDAHY
jgi:hypothetical protein